MSAETRQVIALRWFNGGAADPSGAIVPFGALDTVEGSAPVNALFPSMGWTIGIVALLDEDPQNRYFKVYIGLGGYGSDQDQDAEIIARFGTPIFDEVMARHLAPMCADRGYRT